MLKPRKLPRKLRRKLPYPIALGLHGYLVDNEVLTTIHLSSEEEDES